jgi:ribosomal protein S18 acetylase RimI-like enzyme
MRASIERSFDHARIDHDGRMVTLRPAVAEDADSIDRIYAASWNEGFGHLLGSRARTPERRERWRADLADASLGWVVAEDDTGVVGFVGTGACRDPVEPGLGELHTIAVDPCCWRQGVGRRLMDTALRRLHDDHRFAVLWTVAGYERGRSFYEATGWFPLGWERADGTEVAFGHALDAEPVVLPRRGTGT